MARVKFWNESSQSWEYADKSLIKPPYTADEVGAVSYTEQTLTDEQKAQARENIGAVTSEEITEYLNGQVGLDYSACGLPVLKLTGDVSTMTKDNPVTLNYIYGDRNGTCEVKWQGSSSLAYPKKNYTIKFDNAFEAAEGWGEQKKYCFKANFIDHSHARNVVSAKLWGQIVKSRPLEEIFDINKVTGFYHKEGTNLSHRYTVSDSILTVNATTYAYGIGYMEGQTIPKGTCTISFDVLNPDATGDGDLGRVDIWVIDENEVEQTFRYDITTINTWQHFDIHITTTGNVNKFGLSPHGDSEHTADLAYQFKNISVQYNRLATLPISELPNGGAIDGFPCIIELNGEFHGLYTFNIPKDGWMFNMGKVSEVLEPDNAVNETGTIGTDITTFSYVSTTDYEDMYIRKCGSITGGRLYIDFDSDKISRFSVRIFLFDADGNPYKWIGGYDHTVSYCFPKENIIEVISNNPVIAGGDYNFDEIKWSNPGYGTSYFRIDAPISISIPSGYTPMVQFSGFNQALYPDGTITYVWSTENVANGIWAHRWQKTGITATVIGTSDTSDAKEAIVCANTHASATGFWAEALLDESDFELEYTSNEENTDWILTSLNTLINACLNSDGTDLDTTVAQYLDWQSAIDYYIFVSLIRGTDMMDKNYLLATYDGVKWFFSTYDMDTTYGLAWDGSCINSSKDRGFVNFAAAHKVMQLIKNYKKDELKARYAEIRDTIMSEDNVAIEFLNFVGLIPTVIFNEDVRKWITIPSTASSNVAQILNWYRMRVAAIDKEIEEL